MNTASQCYTWRLLLGNCYERTYNTFYIALFYIIEVKYRTYLDISVVYFVT